jgi:hypothetical protein
MDPPPRGRPLLGRAKQDVTHEFTCIYPVTLRCNRSERAGQSEPPAEQPRDLHASRVESCGAP